MKNFYSVFALLYLFASASYAQVSVKEAKQLDHKLTPIGAERKGNSTGNIPEWTGGLAKKPIHNGQYKDPFIKEKPSFIITNKNAGNYSNQLSPGIKALLKNYSESFNIPVYPTHRTASFPKLIYKNTRWNAEHASLGKNLNSINNVKGGIPFPIPQSGIEVIWNHLLRWRSNYIQQTSNEGVVYPSTPPKIINSLQEVAFPFYYHTTTSINDNILFYYTSRILSPARLAGGALLVVETLDQTHRPRQVWGYDSAQRRVRRFPHVDFDNPALLAENLRTTDDTDMYSGSPTHFQWYIRGKKEMYIPYNNYKLSDSGASLKEVLTPYHLNPEYTRFELHRVWVIEGILKLQYRHIYSKRTFYIDEDSWSIVMADQYDQSGDLWRVSLAYLKNFYDVPLIYPAASVFHDLKKQRYHFQGLTNGEASRGNFTSPPPPKGRFTPAGLRAGIRR